MYYWQPRKVSLNSHTLLPESNKHRNQRVRRRKLRNCNAKHRENRRRTHAELWKAQALYHAQTERWHRNSKQAADATTRREHRAEVAATYRSRALHRPHASDDSPAGPNRSPLNSIQRSLALPYSAQSCGIATQPMQHLSAQQPEYPAYRLFG